MTRGTPGTGDLRSSETAAAGFRAFENIAKSWQLSLAQQATLLGISRSMLYQWRRGKVPRLERHVLERLSYVLGIYKALQILFPTEDDGAQWIRASNTAPLFGGRSALDRMLAGLVSDLYVVRQYLDGQRYR